MKKLSSLAASVLLLAACGDDASSSGAGGGGGASSTSTSSSGGGGASASPFERACADACADYEGRAAELGCAVESACAENLSCDDPSSACATEQIALIDCVGAEVASGQAACFCGADDVLGCDPQCATEAEAFRACTFPISNACLSVDNVFDTCSFDFVSCIAELDEAIAVGCGDPYFDVLNCVALDPDQCDCVGGTVDCSGACPTETAALSACLGG